MLGSKKTGLSTFLSLIFGFTALYNAKHTRTIPPTIGIMYIFRIYDTILLTSNTIPAIIAFFNTIEFFLLDSLSKYGSTSVENVLSETLNSCSV